MVSPQRMTEENISSATLQNILDTLPKEPGVYRFLMMPVICFMWEKERSSQSSAKLFSKGTVHAAKPESSFRKWKILNARQLETKQKLFS